jgi:hypothetical protein
MADMKAVSQFLRDRMFDPNPEPDEFTVEMFMAERGETYRKTAYYLNAAKEKGLITSRRAGKRTYYKLVKE